MKKILIFGNSGSGKSTLAKYLCKSEGFAHLDLDSLAWEDTLPPQRRDLNESKQDILTFIESNNTWVIEGCYTDLLELVSTHSNEIIFMNLSIDDCISNARTRPWEPHKYESKQAQDNNLPMLINWITQYEERNDTFSMAAHQSFFDGYSGQKRMISSNLDSL